MEIVHPVAERQNQGFVVHPSMKSPQAPAWPEMPCPGMVWQLVDHEPPGPA